LARLTELGPFDAARRAISEAIAAFETTGERWRKAEVDRLAGEVALMSANSEGKCPKNSNSLRSRKKWPEVSDEPM
jgi:hypothetical protein